MLVFGDDKELKPKKDYPCTSVSGKALKAPKVYKDVKNQVVADYQQEKEREWVEELRKKYSISVNEDVLKTVNSHE